MSANELIVLIILVMIILVAVLSRKGASGTTFPAYTPPTSEEETDRHVRDFLSRGMKINAIKAYRDYYKVGLKEAKDIVEALDAQVKSGNLVASAPANIPGAGQPSGSFLTQSQADEQVRAFLAAGKKINAIKVYREYYNVGLKEAKDAVEALETGINFGTDPMAGKSGWDSIPLPTSPSGFGGNLDESRIRALLGENKKIEAIKIYREQHLCDLLTAKNAVEAIEREMKLGR